MEVKGAWDGMGKEEPRLGHVRGENGISRYTAFVIMLTCHGDQPEPDERGRD